jgi:hypothetical protein
LNFLNSLQQIALQTNPMNIIFVFAVVVGILYLAVIIVGIIYNAKVGGSSQAAPWMHNLRKYQDNRQNAGWRIQMIPYDDSSKPMTPNSDGALAFVQAVGALGFIAGLVIIFYDQAKYIELGLIIAGLSFLIVLGGFWLKARSEREGWDIASGRCVDREIRKLLTLAGGHSGWIWVWRIVCEYDYLGIKYRVTPTVNWATFSSEKAALKFLEEKISPDGDCKLRVNPKNPLQTELFGQGIKDKLLY